MSKGSLAELEAITAEYSEDTRRNAKKRISKDPFDRPSPGLLKRLARQSAIEEAGPSEDRRKKILESKARKYDALRRGDFSTLSTRDKEEGALDFDRWEERSEDGSVLEDPLQEVEYVDEMGRTRVGTLEEKQRAEQARRPSPVAEQDTAYAQVLRSNVIHGDQRSYPVYQPEQATILRKYQEAEAESRQDRYDANKEARGAGFYNLSHDETVRAEQLSSLRAHRLETERLQTKETAAVARQQKLDQRRALIDQKRRKVMGEEDIDRVKRSKREAEAERILNSI